MGLIDCNDCGGKVSDAAPVCPRCGCPNVLSGASSEGSKVPSNAYVRHSSKIECPACGVENNESNENCLHCARPLAALLEQEKCKNLTNSVLVQKDGQQMGPYSMFELHEKIEQGIISEGDMAWKEGLENWFPVGELINAPNYTKQKIKKREPVSIGNAPSSPSPQTILVSKDGVNSGPFSIGQINQMVADGQLTSYDMAWQEGLDDWVCIDKLHGYALFKFSAEANGDALTYHGDEVSSDNNIYIFSKKSVFGCLGFIILIACAAFFLWDSANTEKKLAKTRLHRNIEEALPVIGGFVGDGYAGIVYAVENWPAPERLNGENRESVLTLAGVFAAERLDHNWDVLDLLMLKIEADKDADPDLYEAINGLYELAKEIRRHVQSLHKFTLSEYAAETEKLKERYDVKENKIIKMLK